MNTYIILLLTAIFLILVDKFTNIKSQSQSSSSTANAYNNNNNRNNCTNCNTNQMVDIIAVLGGPGSGKGTQCQKLVENFGFRHVSVGDLLRAELKNGGARAQEIRQIMKEGKLMPSDIVVQLILNHIKYLSSATTKPITILLDGFPRNTENLQTWHLMTQTHPLTKYINFQCPQKVLEQRLLQRSTISGRSDDNLQTIKKRLKIFIMQTQNVINQIQDDEENRVIEINSDREIQEVWEDLSKKMRELGYKKIN